MAENNQPSLMVGARFVAAQLAAPERIERAIREIEANIAKDPGVVFDHAKSLIETTCKTIFKELGKVPDENWKLGQLAGFTLNAVNRIPDGHPEPEEAKKRLETALKGLVAVVHGLGEIRNLEGEIGHGQEAGRVTLSPCHAEFAARAADTVIKFLVEVYRSGQAADREEFKIAYVANPDFNEYVDELFPPVRIFQSVYKTSEILFQFDPQVYKDALAEFDTDQEGRDE
jgi:hypothetical protein